MNALTTFKIGAATFEAGPDDALSAGLLIAVSPEAQEAGIEAIRATWKRRHRLTPDQARALRWWHRQGWLIAGKGCHVKTRWKKGRKVIAWRIPGKAGADLPGPASGLAVAQAIEAHRVELAKEYRAVRLAFMNALRAGKQLQKGRATAAAVLALLAAGKQVWQVSKLLNLTEQHVRRIRRKANILEKG